MVAQGVISTFPTGSAPCLSAETTTDLARYETGKGIFCRSQKLWRLRQSCAMLGSLHVYNKLFAFNYT